MSRCTACRHPHRDAIGLALGRGEPERSIAKRFALSPAAVHRHRDHISTLVNKLERLEQAEALTARDESRRLYLELRQIADQCLTLRPDQFVEKVADRLDRALRTWGEFNGEAPPSASVQALFVTLGVRGEDELRRALEASRGEAPSLEQARDRALEVLRHVLQRRPEWTGEALGALGVREPSTNGGETA